MPKRDISDVFLEYIRPVLQYFGDPKPRTHSHDAACALGHVVWNAVILDERDPGLEHIHKAKLQGGNIPEIDLLIDMMAARKRSEYGNDKRIIGPYDVIVAHDGSCSIVAEIHDDLFVLH